MFKASIGSTDAPDEEHLVRNDGILDSSLDIDDGISLSTSEETTYCWENDLDKLTDDDLETIMASAAHASPPKGVNAKFLSKIWRIDYGSAEKTLDITSQLSQR